MSDAPLRVLVIAPTPFFGDRGCHVRIYEEVRGLAKLGIDSRVVTYSSGRDLPDVSIERAPRLPGVRPGGLGPSLGRPLLDVSLLQASWRVARKFKPHLLHGHLHEGIAIGAAVRGSYRVPLIADLQGSLTAELADHGFLSDGGVAARVVRGIESWLVRRPDRILTSSHHGVALLKSQGVRPEKIEPLPDGVDLDVFCPQPPDPDIRARLKLDKKRVVVFLGVLTAYQGIDLLLDAVPLVVRSEPNAHFVVMGYPNEEHYRGIARARGLEGYVTFTGRVPYADASRWLSVGEVAVSAKRSLTEANGKLLNYMACGLPVVASDIPVNRELLGDAGVYAPVGDSTALGSCIVELLRDRERAHVVGTTLRRRAEAMFAWPVLTRRLAEFYREVLKAVSC